MRLKGLLIVMLVIVGSKPSSAQPTMWNSYLLYQGKGEATLPIRFLTTNSTVYVIYTTVKDDDIDAFLVEYHDNGGSDKILITKYPTYSIHNFEIFQFNNEILIADIFREEVGPGARVEFYKLLSDGVIHIDQELYSEKVGILGFDSGSVIMWNSSQIFEYDLSQQVYSSIMNISSSYVPYLVGSTLYLLELTATEPRKLYFGNIDSGVSEFTLLPFTSINQLNQQIFFFDKGFVTYGLSSDNIVCLLNDTSIEQQFIIDNQISNLFLSTTHKDTIDFVYLHENEYFYQSTYSLDGIIQDQIQISDGKNGNGRLVSSNSFNQGIIYDQDNGGNSQFELLVDVSYQSIQTYKEPLEINNDAKVLFLVAFLVLFIFLIKNKDWIRKKLGKFSNHQNYKLE